MLDTWKTLIAGQFEAALCTLSLCIDRCGEAAWNAPVGTHPFCRVAFHTLFFTDYYLGANEDAFRSQPFHRDHPELFCDYKELAWREPVLLYDKPAVQSYLQHCRDKAAAVTAAEIAATLRGPCGFARKVFTRAELHVYNIRHIQHHAAQLSLRLRIDAGEDIPWVRSGWTDA